MKYVKVPVPDDFDSEIDRIYLLQSGYTSPPSQISVNLHPWESKYVPVLDNGFLGIVDFMGDDDCIAEAARVSYGTGTKQKTNNTGLIRYLRRHRHTTPYEMIEVKFHVKLPIFVMRQWVRHRTANINEYSGRYSIMDSDMYIPEFDHMMPQSGSNKQGRDGSLTDTEKQAVLSATEQLFDDAYQTYEYLLGLHNTPPDRINARRIFVEEAAMAAITKLRNEAQGEFTANDLNREWVAPTDAMIDAKIKEYYAANDLAVFDQSYPGLARELARIVLPVANYTQMYWKCDLHNIMHFLGLRMDSHAQYEIRVYAQAMFDLLLPLFPVALEAFYDYDLHGMRLSRMEKRVLSELYNLFGKTDTDMGSTNPDVFVTDLLKEENVSDREIKEFLSKIKTNSVGLLQHKSPNRT